MSLTSGTLRYQAAAGETNRVFIVDAFDGFRVIDTTASVTPGAGCASVNSSEAFCLGPLSFALRIHVIAGDMDDYVLVHSYRYDTSRLEGGDGADELEGGELTDVLDGGAGPDILHGLSTVERDMVDYSVRTNPVTVTINDGLANDGEAGENDLISKGITIVRGGQAADTMSCHGGSTDGEFNPVLSGLGGNDHLTATCPSADLRGGNGDDTIRATSPFSEMTGGSGDDIVTGGPGQFQFLSGGDGQDTINGGRGRDDLDGGAGADRLVGGDGIDAVLGGSGRDTLLTRDGERDRVRGGSGRDRARVDRALDQVRGIERFF